MYNYTCISIHMCIYIYIYNTYLRASQRYLEIVLFETSNSMKPCPSVFHTNTNKLRPVKGFVEPKPIDEVSNRIPETSQLQPQRCR